MKKLQSDKAITLIALVITIIILIILAGISISLLFAENGIINKANKAKSETNTAKAMEDVGIAYSSCNVDYLANGKKNKSESFSRENMNTQLSNGRIVDGEENYKYNSSTDDIYMKYKDMDSVVYELNIDSLGNITLISVNGEKISVTDQIKAIIENARNKAKAELKADGKSFSLDNDSIFAMCANLEDLYITNNNGEEVTALYKDTHIVKITIDNITVTENNEYNIIKNNVSEMKNDTNLKVNDIVYTKGYFAQEDGGRGLYKIIESSETVDNGRIIKLNNGLIAKLILSNKTIDIKQYGAIGDNTTDDTSVIQTVISQLNTDECKYLTIAKGNYVITSNISLVDGKYRGYEGAVLVCKGTYSKEYIISNANIGKSATEVNTIELNNIKFIANTDNRVVMIRMYNTNNSRIKNCTFNTIEGNTIGSTSIDLYSNNKNFTVDNCKSILYASDDSLNTAIEIREYKQTETSENITINDCYFEKNGKDELIWLDSWFGNLNYISVKNCTLKDNGIATSTFFIGGTQNNSVGQNTLKNVEVSGCKIEKEKYCYRVIKILDEVSQNCYAENVRFHDNQVEVKSLLNDSALSDWAGIIAAGDGTIISGSKDIIINNNTIKSNVDVKTVVTSAKTNGNGNIISMKDNSYYLSKCKYIMIGINNIDGEKFYDLSGNNNVICDVFSRNCESISNVTLTLAKTDATNYRGRFISDYNYTGVTTKKIYKCNITTEDVLITIVTKDSITDRYTTTIEDSTINNSANLGSIWFSDLNKAYSDTEPKYGISIKNSNVAKKSIYGTINVVTE